MSDKFSKFGGFINRENKIFEILQDFIDNKLDFIIVGGYAVSSYRHRFSIDADIVIKHEDKTKFEEILNLKGYEKDKNLNLNHVYACEFLSYKLKSELPVTIDILTGGLGSRTSEASFSFEQLKEHSEKRKIIGVEKEVVALVPKKEILIVLKLHSGRLTDFRDIVAISKEIDMGIVKSYIWRGKKEVVKDNIKKLIPLLDDKGFIGSFKGTFIEKKYDIDPDEVRKLTGLLI